MSASVFEWMDSYDMFRLKIDTRWGFTNEYAIMTMIYVSVIIIIIIIIIIKQNKQASF